MLSGNDLTGWDLTGQDLTGADFRNSELTGVDFTNAEIRGAILSAATDYGFTSAQLYSTGSYQAGDLSGIGLTGNDMAGWVFAGKNLTDASF